jgi:diacylglycerol kinase family enzyme
MIVPGAARPGGEAQPPAADAAAIPVFFNASAGSGIDAAELLRAGAAHGLRLAPVPMPADDATVAAWRARRPPLWVAAGGDGTVRSVAAWALDAGAELAVLPTGTRNHFARDLGLPLALDDAVAVLAAGHARTVDVGDLGGELFLNNASLGLYTRFVLVREHEEQRPGLKLWPALAKAAWHALRTSRDLEVRLHAEDDAQRRRTPVLLVGNNRYTVEGLERGKRERLDGGRLAVYVLHPRSRAALAWFGLRALFGAVSTGRDFDTLDTDTLEVASRRPELEVALDGEVLRMPTPLRFRIRPGALRVRVPAPEDR